MNQITIELLANNNISVIIPGGSIKKASGYLLSSSGVKLEQFVLQPGMNNITLRTKKRGNYVLRVETMNEVAVKQVLIKK